MANFEAFYQVISSSINLLFLKSVAWAIYVVVFWSHPYTSYTHMIWWYLKDDITRCGKKSFKISIFCQGEGRWQVNFPLVNLIILSKLKKYHLGVLVIYKYTLSMGKKLPYIGSVDLLSHFTKVKCDSWT